MNCNVFLLGPISNRPPAPSIDLPQKNWPLFQRRVGRWQARFPSQLIVAYSNFPAQTADILGPFSTNELMSHVPFGVGDLFRRLCRRDRSGSSDLLKTVYFRTSCDFTRAEAVNGA